MDKEEYIEDFNDRTIYYHVPTSVYDFNGFWVLSEMFTKWRKDRKARKQKRKALDDHEELIVPPERQIDTITI